MSTSSRKKTKASAPKKTHKKKSKKSNQKKLDMYTIKKIIVVFFTLSLASYAFYLGQDYNSSSKDKVLDNKTIINNISKKTDTIINDYNKIIKKDKVIKNEKIKKDKKPKLVIIIDDVYTKKQLLVIQSLNMNITPSIFPPFKLAHNSHVLADNLKHYMVHLPMESKKRQFNKHYKTLKISSSKEDIIHRIEEIRKLFPTAKYINNHTGSLFTSNYASMSLAYKSMRENGFIFIDSKTIHTSKVKKIANEYGDRYIARDVFIDNTHTVAYIHKQLREAVSIAKRKKYAIVIGHPHKVTMRALSLAKEILKDVELVYIDDLVKQISK